MDQIRQRFIVISMYFTFIVTLQLSAQDYCGDILTDGVFKNFLYSEKSLNKMVLASKISRYTWKEANSKFGADIKFPIDGIPVGLGFSEEQYTQWKKSLNASLNVTQINQHALDIIVSEGDQAVINAWSECMKNQQINFLARLKRLDDLNYILKLEWNKGNLQPENVRLENNIEIEGAIVKSNVHYLRKNYMFKDGVARECKLKRININSPIIITGQIKDLDPFTIYIPAIKPLPEVITKRKVKFKMWGGPNSVSDDNGYITAWINVGEKYEYAVRPGGNDTWDTMVGADVGTDLRVRVRLHRPERNSVWRYGPWIQYNGEKSKVEDDQLHGDCIILDNFLDDE